MYWKLFVLRASDTKICKELGVIAGEKLIHAATMMCPVYKINSLSHLGGGGANIKVNQFGGQRPELIILGYACYWVQVENLQRKVQQHSH